MIYVKEPFVNFLFLVVTFSFVLEKCLYFCKDSLVVMSSDWFFFIFSSSLSKFSLCLFILFPSSVSILITNALNSLSGKLFISVSLVVFVRGFLLLFRLKQTPLSSHFNFVCLYEIR